jgi:hypothetical protein
MLRKKPVCCRQKCFEAFVINEINFIRTVSSLKSKSSLYSLVIVVEVVVEAFGTMFNRLI